MFRPRRTALTFGALGLSLLLLAPALTIHAAGSAAHVHATVRVTVQNFAFSPETLTIAPGTTVIWTQKDSSAHTVTSDSGAWSDAGPLQAGQTFAHTFTKVGTYPYHCAIHPTMTARVIVSSGRMTGGMTGAGRMGSMGPMSKTSITSFTGWYDKHKVLFLATDTSSKSEALREHINYSASLAKALPHTVPMYMVTNGAWASRGPVFGSQPGEKDYTPLWQEVLVTWKTPSRAVALGSDNQIKDLARAGKLTLTMTATVLNCPIIKVQGGT